MNSEPNTRLSGMKQDIQDMKNELTQYILGRSLWFNKNLKALIAQLINIKYDLKKYG